MQCERGDGGARGRGAGRGRGDAPALLWPSSLLEKQRAGSWERGSEGRVGRKFRCPLGPRLKKKKWGRGGAAGAGRARCTHLGEAGGGAEGGAGRGAGAGQGADEGHAVKK